MKTKQSTPIIIWGDKNVENKTILLISTVNLKSDDSPEIKEKKWFFSSRDKKNTKLKKLIIIFFSFLE